MSHDYSIAFLRFTQFNQRAQYWQGLAEERGFSLRRIRQVVRVERKLMAKADRIMLRNAGLPLTLRTVAIKGDE